MKKKITFIDLIIVAVIIIAAVVGVKFIGKNGQSTGETVKYQVLVTDIYPAVAEKMTASDNVLLDTKEDKYGKVIKVEIKPAETTNLDLNNEKYVVNSVSEKNDAYITVEANAEKSESGWKLGSQDIKVGSPQSLSCAEYAANGYIIDIFE